MNVIGVFILLVLIFRLIVSGYKENTRKRQKIENAFCWITSAIIVILAAFRAETVGTDTMGYVRDYADVSLMSFSDISDRYEGYLGYYYLSKVFTMMGMPCYVWFGFLELVFMLSISRFINKFSSDRLYSLILFIVTGLFAFSLAGLKQTLAMSFMFFAYTFFVDRKYIVCAIWVALTYFTHPTALLSLVMFFLYAVRNKRYYWLITIAGVLVIWFGNMILMSKFVSFLGQEHYEMYLDSDSSYTMNTLVLYLLMLLCTMPYLSRYLKHSDVAKVEFGGALLVCAFQYLASFSPSLFRLALCFIPFLIVYVPNAFDISTRNTNGGNMSIFKILALIGPIVFYLYASRHFVYRFI